MPASPAVLKYCQTQLVTLGVTSLFIAFAVEGVVLGRLLQAHSPHVEQAKVAHMVGMFGGLFAFAYGSALPFTTFSDSQLYHMVLATKAMVWSFIVASNLQTWAGIPVSGFIDGNFPNNAAYVGGLVSASCAAYATIRLLWNLLWASWAPAPSPSKTK